MNILDIINRDFKPVSKEELQQLLTEEQIKYLEEHNFLAPDLVIRMRNNLLRIRTSDWTWKCLCGREWEVNLDTLESWLSCMN